MYKAKNLLSALIALTFTFSSAAASQTPTVTAAGSMVTGLAAEAEAAAELTVPTEAAGETLDIIYSIKSGALKKIVLPASIKTIYENAFSGCPALTEINLDSVTTIYSRAFEGCASLKSIAAGQPKLPADCAVGDRAFAGTGFKSFILDRNIGQGREVFAGCPELSHLGLTTAVTELGGGVFKDCASLDYLCLPQSLNYLSDGAFAGCSGLRTAVFPAKNVILTDDADEVFASCPNLTIVGMANTTVEAYAKAHDIPFIPSVIPANARSSAVGEAVCTATVSINGIDIPAYTVCGSVYVGENALKSLGIECEWQRATRSTLVTVPEGTKWSVRLDTNPSPYAISIFSSDTVFYFGGFRIPAFNVGNGESIVDVNALAGRVLY